MRNIIAFILLLCSVTVAAQHSLQLQTDNGKLFLTHTVQAKENWYSIGRIYNISPRDIAPFNNLNLQTALSIGQTLRIPMMEVNFAQDNKKAADEVFIPLYHTVTEKEGLFRISQSYNKVPVENLKSWNKLGSESVSVGSNVIVGYLKVKKELSPLAGANYSVPPVTTPVVKAEVPKEEPKKVVTETVKKEEPKKTEVVKQDPPPVPQPKVEVTVKPGEGGFFSTEFSEQTNNGKKVQASTGTAAVFKSTSGWTDSKYYALMNNITPGTILRISSQGKTVYAKVLGAMPDIKQNEGLMLRISNAAARALNAGDKFTADIAWEK